MLGSPKYHVLVDGPSDSVVVQIFTVVLLAYVLISLHLLAGIGCRAWCGNLNLFEGQLLSNGRLQRLLYL
jgi:hypothetical protein